MSIIRALKCPSVLKDTGYVCLACRYQLRFAQRYQSTATTSGVEGLSNNLNDLSVSSSVSIEKSAQDVQDSEKSQQPQLGTTQPSKQSRRATTRRLRASKRARIEQESASSLVAQRQQSSDVIPPETVERPRFLVRKLESDSSKSSSLPTYLTKNFSDLRSAVIEDEHKSRSDRASSASAPKHIGHSRSSLSPPISAVRDADQDQGGRAAPRSRSRVIKNQKRHKSATNSGTDKPPEEERQLAHAVGTSVSESTASAKKALKVKKVRKAKEALKTEEALKSKKAPKTEEASKAKKALKLGGPLKAKKALKTEEALKVKKAFKAEKISGKTEARGIKAKRLQNSVLKKKALGNGKTTPASRISSSRSITRSNLLSWKVTQKNKPSGTGTSSVDKNGTGVSTSKSSGPCEAGSAEVSVLKPIELKISALDIDQPPVPVLQHGLDRVLFNRGVYQLQDSHSRVYNFDPYLQKIMPVIDFNFKALKEYKTSSQDEALSSIARREGKKYIGSTSSMTGTLTHFHYLLSNMRNLNLEMLSRGFTDQSATFTRINQAPNAIFLRWKDGTYAIDADKEYDGANVLMMLGKSMEKLLTLPTEDFERYRKDHPVGVSQNETDTAEAFHYTTMGDFLMRSQLDAYDSRLPGTGMFDLKTRAVVSVRMETENFQPMTGYQIHTLQGRYESYEREYYDMMRSTMLKYMLQVRMGRMDGIFLAYHNVERIFGFQYLPLGELDRALHGQVDTCLGDQEFRASLHLLNQALESATAKYPKQSLRVHFETCQENLGGHPSTAMWIYAEPMSDAEIDEIQATGKAKIAAFESTAMGINSSDKESISGGTPSVGDAADVADLTDFTEAVPTFSGDANESEQDVVAEDAADVADPTGLTEAVPTFSGDANESEQDVVAEDAADVADPTGLTEAVPTFSGDANESEPDVVAKDGADVVDANESKQDVVAEDAADVVDSANSMEAVPIFSGDANESEQDDVVEDAADMVDSKDLTEAVPTFSEDTNESEQDAVAKEGQSDTSSAESESIRALDGSEKELKPLFVASLIVKSRVNGSERPRPTPLQPKDVWEIEYLLQEWEGDESMWARYKSMKARRREVFTNEVDEDEELQKTKKSDSYIRFLEKISQEGRKFRNRIDTLEKGREQVVVGEPPRRKAAEHNDPTVAP